jgi:hypothetical protein
METQAGREDIQRNAGKTQALFRDVNERVLESPTSAGVSESEIVTMLCECADDACVEQIVLPKAEYEEIRGHPARFVIKAGHEVPEAERVVAGSDGTTIVEKFGRAAEVAVTRDPRDSDPLTA